MSFTHSTGTILAKELRTEFRSRELLGTTVVFVVLYNIAILPVLGPLVLVLALGTVGLATTGTVFSAVAAQARLRELLLPLLLLPVLAPVLVASTEATAGILRDPSELSPVWLTFLTAFDIVFLTAAWLFGEYLLEE